MCFGRVTEVPEGLSPFFRRAHMVALAATDNTGSAGRVRLYRARPLHPPPPGGYDQYVRIYKTLIRGVNVITDVI